MARYLDIEYIKQEYDKADGLHKARYAICSVFNGKMYPRHLSEDLEDAKRRYEHNKKYYDGLILLDLETMQTIDL